MHRPGVWSALHCSMGRAAPINLTVGPIPCEECTVPIFRCGLRQHAGTACDPDGRVPGAAGTAAHGPAWHRTVNKRRDARSGPVGYCSNSTLGFRHGAISCRACMRAL